MGIFEFVKDAGRKVGLGDRNAPDEAAAAAAEKDTVKSGDTLSKIAREHYGDAGAYMKIFEANTPMLKDPDLIHPGQVLRIPEA